MVYNHTAEADDKDPYLISLRGIENKTYYMTDITQPHQVGEEGRLGDDGWGGQ